MLSPATSASRSAKLSVRGVGKRYHLGNRMTIEAVRDVSFDVTEGEICALLGPSGCGKSTMLRMVAGLEDPSTGSMFLDGKHIDGPDKSGNGLQRYTLDWMTVQKNVSTGCGSMIPLTERRENAQRFIQLVKLTSSRMPTLTSFPVACSSGSPSRGRWVRVQRPPSSPFVTHDVVEAIFLADRILFMSRHPGTIRE
jgi:ABC-type nitrate/sulfonate/bicarbonate transport system ATPase subunit